MWVQGESLGTRLRNAFIPPPPKSQFCIAQLRNILTFLVEFVQNYAFAEEAGALMHWGMTRSSQAWTCCWLETRAFWVHVPLIGTPDALGTTRV